MKYSLPSLLIAVLVIFFSLLASVRTHANAQTSRQNQLTLSPPSQEVTVEKDQEQVEVPITITNPTSTDLDIKLSVIDFGSLNESGGVAFLGNKPGSNETRYSLSSWMTLGKDTLILKSRQSQQVNVIITNRQSLSPGGHYGAVLATITGDSSTGDSQQVAINQTISSLIFLKKMGGERENLSLESVQLDPFRMVLPQDMTLRLQNSGNVHLTPRGLISITDPLGQIVEKGVINEDSSLILPETFRRYQVFLSPLSLAYLIGEYHVDIAFRYQGQETFSHMNARFFFVPWFIPVSVIAVLVLAIMATFIYRKRKASHAEKA